MKTQTRLRPRAFARYSAASASRNSASPKSMSFRDHGRCGPSSEETPTVTVSVGVSSDDGPHRPWSLNDIDFGEALFREADAALYRAKARGRNRVCVFMPSPLRETVGQRAAAPQEVVVMSWD